MAASEVHEALESRKRRGNLNFWDDGHVEEVRVEEIRRWVT